MKLESCLLSQNSAELLDKILIRQELELMRWQRVSFSIFLKTLFEYSSSLKSKDRDIKFLLINILFYIYPEQMQKLFIKISLKKMGQTKKGNMAEITKTD
jgi:hypothetical protein